MTTQDTLRRDEQVAGEWDLPGPDSVRLVECGEVWRVDVFDAERVWERYEWDNDGDARLCVGLLAELGREVIGVTRPTVRDELVPTAVVAAGQPFVVSWLWLQGLAGVPEADRSERKRRVCDMLGVTGSTVQNHTGTVRVRA